MISDDTEVKIASITFFLILLKILIYQNIGDKLYLNINDHPTLKTIL